MLKYVSDVVAFQTKLTRSWAYDDAVGSAVVAASNGPEPLLSSCVPLQQAPVSRCSWRRAPLRTTSWHTYYLQLDDLAIQLHSADFLQPRRSEILLSCDNADSSAASETHEVDADCGDVALSVGVILHTRPSSNVSPRAGPAACTNTASPSCHLSRECPFTQVSQG